MKFPEGSPQRRGKSYTYNPPASGWSSEVDYACVDSKSDVTSIRPNIPVCMNFRKFPGANGIEFSRVENDKPHFCSLGIFQ